MHAIQQKTHLARRSACAEKSLMMEIDRYKRMSVMERIKIALTIKDRFAWLKPVRDFK